MKKRLTILLLLFTFIVNSCSVEEQKKVEEKIQPPEWSYDATIYEVNIRQYTEEGTFKAFEEHLPRLRELGIEILWLMPIHPIGDKNRKGTLGSYYSVKDYKEINPEFGSKEDFQNLIDKAHSMGFYVIIDWVANHTAWDHEWTVTNPEFYTKDADGNFMPPAGTDWSDVIDINYDNHEVWSAMTDALEYWVRDFNIDGYRCDVAAMVPTEFWNQARKKLDAIKPLFMLAEAHEPELHSAFDMTYNWHLKDIMNRIASGENDVTHLRDHISDEKTKYQQNDFRMTFTTNHDENSWNGTVFERLGDGVETFAVLTMTLPGMPLVYSGQEAGLNKALNFFEKDLINWQEHELTAVYKTYLNLKKKNKALSNGVEGGELILIKNSSEHVIFSFSREKENDKLIAIFNLSDNEINVTFNDITLAGSYKVVGSDESINLENEYNRNFGPWEYLVLSSN